MRSLAATSTVLRDLLLIEITARCWKRRLLNCWNDIIEYFKSKNDRNLCTTNKRNVVTTCEGGYDPFDSETSEAVIGTLTTNLSENLTLVTQNKDRGYAQAIQEDKSINPDDCHTQSSTQEFSRWDEVFLYCKLAAVEAINLILLSTQTPVC